MKEINTAKNAVICFLFLIILYFTSYIDWAFSISFITAAVIFNFPSVILFLSAFSAFVLFVLFSFLSFQPDFIGDLTISSYLLFLGAILVYFRQGKSIKWQLLLPFRYQIEISQKKLIKIGGIFVFSILIFPLTNPFVSVIGGYLVFLYLFKRNDGKYAFIISLFFLILCSVLLIFNKEKVSEISAVFTFYFLVIGTVQEIINLVRHRSDHKNEDEGSPDTGNIGYMRHSERIRAFRSRLNRSAQETSVTFFSKNRKISLLFISAVIMVVISFIFYKPLTNTSDKTLKFTVTPAISPINTITPVADETKLASEASRLKISVENGTEVRGYAATIAGELRKSGISDITVGNANRSDFGEWELTLKAENKELAGYIKKILNLKTLKINPASGSAQFDMIITIGGEK